MKDIELKAGDFFCVESSNGFSRIIRAVERLWDKDNDAEHSHSGIIIDELGNTLESLTTIRKANISSCDEKQVIIGRLSEMTPEKFQNGINAIKDDIGKLYPFWRLFLFTIPFLAKYNISKVPVCSELVCKFLLGAGFEQIGQWRGQNPDDVADMIHKWKGIITVFDGEWRRDA